MAIQTNSQAAREAADLFFLSKTALAFIKLEKHLQNVEQEQKIKHLFDDFSTGNRTLSKSELCNKIELILRNDDEKDAFEFYVNILREGNTEHKLKYYMHELHSCMARRYNDPCKEEEIFKKIRKELDNQPLPVLEKNIAPIKARPDQSLHRRLFRWLGIGGGLLGGPTDSGNLGRNG